MITVHVIGGVFREDDDPLTEFVEATNMYGVSFSKSSEGCDAVLYLNTPKLKRVDTFFVAPENIFSSVQEPVVGYQKILFGDNVYQKNMAKIFSPYNFLAQHYRHKHITSFPSLWSDIHINKKEQLVHKKTKAISSVISNMVLFEGHRRRNDFINLLKQRLKGNPHIHFFGRGTNLVENKADALQEYYFSIAIENSSIPNYFSEKITDCFLTDTIPIYFGCPNIHEYFAEDSYVWIDLSKPEEAIQKIQFLAEHAEQEYQKRFQALQESKQKCLNEYRPSVAMAKLIAQHYKPDAIKRQEPFDILFGKNFYCHYA